MLAMHKIPARLPEANGGQTCFRPALQVPATSGLPGQRTDGECCTSSQGKAIKFWELEFIGRRPELIAHLPKEYLTVLYASPRQQAVGSAHTVEIAISAFFSAALVMFAAERTERTAEMEWPCLSHAYRLPV